MGQKHTPIEQRFHPTESDFTKSIINRIVEIKDLKLKSLGFAPIVKYCDFCLEHLRRFLESVDSLDANLTLNPAYELIHFAPIIIDKQALAEIILYETNVIFENFENDIEGD